MEKSRNHIIEVAKKNYSYNPHNSKRVNTLFFNYFLQKNFVAYEQLFLKDLLELIDKIMTSIDTNHKAVDLSYITLILRIEYLFVLSKSGG